MQKLIALFLVLALFAGACGGSDDNDGGGDSSAAPDSEPAEEAVEAEAEPTPLTSDGEGDQGETTDESEIVTGGTATFGLVSDGSGFDTTGAIQPGSLRIISALNDSLVGVDENQEWKPLLAESLVPSDDFLTWTINLREGVVFHDGAPVDGDAVQRNMEAFRTSSVTGPAFGPIASVTAVDELTVEVAMSTPWAAFPYALVGQGGYMVSPDTIGMNEMFVGTGPFMMVSWTPGDGAEVVRNPNYWRADEGLPYLDAISFKVIPEQNSRRQALEAGDIDAYVSPSDSDVVDFLADDAIDVYIGQAAGNEFMVILNTAEAPADDLRIRQAMAHALDRQLIIDTFRSGLTVTANSFVDPQSGWHVETEWPAFDLDRAAELVAEYEAEVGPAVIALKATNTPSVQETAELIISFWNDVGIEATIDPVAPGTEVFPVLGDAFQASTWFQFSSVDPDPQYHFFHSSGGPLNWSNLNSEAIDEGFDIGRATDDPDERAAGYAQVQEALAAELPILWVDHLLGVEGLVATPQVHDIVNSTFPDGSPTIGLLAGAFFSWAEVWVG